MGAETSVLENTDWGEPYPHGLWSICQGSYDDKEITLFTSLKKDDTHNRLLEKHTKNLRSVRHPSIITYVYSDIASHGPRLVTEKAVPVDSILPSLTSTEICAGLHTTLDALFFLHENVGSCHNNIHLGAIYVSSDGSWRMGDLEHMCKFSEATQAYLESCKTYRNQEGLSPEEKQGKVSTETELGHARDIFSFAVMTESLLEKMQDLGDLTKTFELRIQDECLHSDPRRRPTAKSLLSDRLFNTEFLSVALFLKNVTLKSEEERKVFFSNLMPRLLHLPEELVARRLVPSLLTRFVFLDQSAVENLLPSLLTPKEEETSPTETLPGKTTPLFSEDVFQQFVVPKLVKIFSVYDFHVHSLLLQYFPKFVHLIDKEDLEFEVFPQLLLGLRDSSDQIACLSLHALAELVPILGRDVVIGGKSKKYYKEGLPKNHSNERLPTVNNKCSNKTRLVDLARQGGTGKSESSKPIDVDKKWKEREMRREEKKKKREERKKAREKVKGFAQKVTDTSSLELGTVQAEQVIKEQHSMNSPPVSPRISEDNHVISNLQSDWSRESGQPDSPKSDWIDSKDVSAVNETEEADWSGWSEEEEDSDDLISEEIEKELQNMDIGRQSTTGSEVNSVPSEPNPKPKKSVRSFSSNEKKTGAMKLSGHKIKSDKSQSVFSTTEDLTEIIRNDNNSAVPSWSDTSLGKGVSSKSKGSKSEESVPKKSISSSKQQILGAEFEIKTLDITVKNKPSDPFDFFADMAPVIESKKDKVDGGKSSTDSAGVPVSMDTADSRFSVQGTSKLEDTEVGGGWGDDDW